MSLLIVLSTMAPVRAEARPLSLSQFARLAHQCGPNVAVSTLAAIARTESRFEPFTVNDNTARLAGTPQTAADAQSIAFRLIAAGHSVDLGLMQVNSSNLGAIGLTVEQALGPCRSIAAGAMILAGDYAGGSTHAEQQAALRVAISRYNTGDDERGFANGYIHKVELSNARVVPALDLEDAVATSLPSGPGKPVPNPTAPAEPPSWEVFPPDGETLAPRAADGVQGPGPDHAASTVADAEPGPSPVVINDLGPLQINLSEAP